MAKKRDSIWEKAPEQDNFDSAAKFLKLVLGDRKIRACISRLRKTPTLTYEAKDLLRACQLPLLDKDESHVADDLKKIDKKKKLSPVLLVRGNAQEGVPLIIADGYHRICASYHWDESCPVACRIVSA